MDLSTSYLGLSLKSPLIVGASPLSTEIEVMLQAQDAGAGAVVMHSLFQEQIEYEQKALDYFLTANAESYAEALSYFPEPSRYHNIDAEAYLAQMENLKRHLEIPVIGSLNGVSKGGWLRYAKRFEDAGADALELNIFYVPTDLKLTALDIEKIYLENVQAVKSELKIPVAVKLSPFFSAFANFASHLDETGVDGMVLFNRFFAPDIDLDALEVVPNLVLSDRYELGLVLRWIAILYGNIKADLAATSGVHQGEDIIKALMAGANVVMITSALLKNGVKYAATMLSEMKTWMVKHDYNSVNQMRGSMSYKNVVEPAAYERANYMKTLQSYSAE